MSEKFAITDVHNYYYRQRYFKIVFERKAHYFYRLYVDIRTGTFWHRKDNSLFRELRINPKQYLRYYVERNVSKR